ncbi:ATP-binding protein [Streptomyces sp. NPDC005355]|uniref:ATP-binding protein n=1 Tax=Streptomyces sp. NPDC005355 TaxID=3157038 RepID=UPI0033B7F77F
MAHNARALVTATLADWRLLPVLDDVVLCASELVSNAVQHADRPVIGGVEDRRISVGMRCWGAFALFLEVGDYDRRMPTLAECPDRMALDGRGLFIVDQLADRLWWDRAAHGGKVVYARFHLPRYGLTRTMVGP